MNDQGKLNVRVVEASISDFVGIESKGISERYRSSDVCVVLVRYQVLDLATLLICSPQGYVWKYLNLGDTYYTAWGDELVKQAEQGKLKDEIKASRLRLKSLPNGLFEFGDVDKLLHPINYLNSWYKTLNVPPQVVPIAIQRIRDWVAQLGYNSVLSVPDEIALPATWGLVDLRLGSKPDHDLFMGIWGCDKAPQWAGENGIPARLLEQIRLLENIGQHTLRIEDEFLPAVRFPEISRSNLRNDKTAEKWRWGSGVGADIINLKNLDHLFACYARLTNLLDWPQLYPSAKAIYLSELPFAEVKPIVPDLFCDPFAELREYLDRQEQRYPVLKSDPLV